MRRGVGGGWWVWFKGGGELGVKMKLRLLFENVESIRGRAGTWNCLHELWNYMNNPLFSPASFVKIEPVASIPRQGLIQDSLLMLMLCHPKYITVYFDIRTTA